MYERLVVVCGIALGASLAHASSCDPQDIFAKDVLFGTGDAPWDVAIGDLDGDGDADLAVANSNNDNVSVLLNNGDGTFASDVR